MATLFLPLLAWTQFDRIDVEEIDNGGAVSGKTFGFMPSCKMKAMLLTLYLAKMVSL